MFSFSDGYVIMNAKTVFLRKQRAQETGNIAAVK